MEILQQFWTRIKPHLVWTMIGTIFLLYLVSWATHYFTQYDWFSTMLSQAATAVLVSGVFASLLKSYQFSELFKQELAGFFTAPEMIKKMREIAIFGRTGDDVIHKAMEHALNVHCPALNSKFHRSATKLLRFKHEYFHRNFVREITLAGYNPATGIITIRDDMSSGLEVTANTSYVSTHVGVVFEDQQTTVTKMTLSTNGAAAECMKKHAKFDGEHFKVEFPLASGSNYRLNRVLDQSYLLRKDPVIQQQFVRFSEGMTLRVINEVTDKLDFSVRFINFEEQVQPEELLGKNNATCQKTYTIDHLTFPYQGFIVTISPT